jgi:hypothetical protein
MSAVFSSIPVSLPAFSINSSSTLSVLLICISMHDLCIHVKGGGYLAAYILATLITGGFVEGSSVPSRVAVDVT